MAEITAKTKLLCVIGSPIFHSLSPRIHNFFAGEMGLDYVYTAFDIGTEQLSGFIRAARLLDIGGFNVTMPLKEAIMPFLDGLSDTARLYGSVNTVVRRGGLLEGHNTDGGGFLNALSGLSDMTGRALILGAGGAAKTAAAALSEKGVSVTMAARRKDLLPPRPDIRICRWEDAAKAARGCSLLVNATPLGMEGSGADFGDLSFLSGLGPGALVFDMVYAPRETALLKEAARLGLKAENGLAYLVHQAALAFGLFTGESPGRAVTDRALI